MHGLLRRFSPRNDEVYFELPQIFEEALLILSRHCEKRSDEAIHVSNALFISMDCRVGLAASSQ